MNKDLFLKNIELKLPKYDPSRFTRLDDTWRGLVNWHNSYYKLLWAAVKFWNPETLVEIGRERGVSANIMLDAMAPEAHLTSIDIVEESIFLIDVDDPRLTLITGNSLDVVDQVPDYIDFLFIDGDHTGEHVRKEWDLYSPKISPAGIVFFDDIHFNDGMTEFWNSLEGWERYDISEWHEKGFGVLFT